jgi:hypothetical protein
MGMVSAILGLLHQCQDRKHRIPLAGVRRLTRVRAPTTPATINHPQRLWVRDAQSRPKRRP